MQQQNSKLSFTRHQTDTGWFIIAAKCSFGLSSLHFSKRLLVCSPVTLSFCSQDISLQCGLMHKAPMHHQKGKVLLGTNVIQEQHFLDQEDSVLSVCYIDRASGGKGLWSPWAKNHNLAQEKNLWLCS